MVTKEFLPFSKPPQKPYYYKSKNPHVSVVFTTTLFGPAPERITRALPRKHQRMSPDDSVIPRVNVTPKQRITLVRSIAAPRENALRRAEITTEAGCAQCVLLIEHF
jgi:hypothetical protein